jgi:5-methylcytosine-specific restriction endonuclease McrA
MDFFVDDRKHRNGITITDTLLTLASTNQAGNLSLEVEARWRLVETAWSLDVPPAALVVQYDSTLESLFVEIPRKRIGITGCRDALNGYQRGRCFYCRCEIMIDGEPGLKVDVDHFFPRILESYSEFGGLNLNGVWNLVLACQACNRGKGGKLARVPEPRYLERLHARNQFYIESTHPLRETLINQTGNSESQRRSFLSQVDEQAIRRLLHRWKSPHEQDPSF